MLLWRSCIVHVYKDDNDTSLGEQFSMCDGKGIVPHGTSVWLCGRRGSVKTRPPLSP